MDRDGLIRLLRTVRCTFELDFTEEVLSGVSLERLRHIATAASLNARQRSSSCQRKTAS